jgi:3-methyl-2-oxobutanoate hydroxymethyltransferase
MKIQDFSQAKAEQRKLTMVTCYDHWSAKIISDSQIDCVLVGDSVSMVVHGFDSTVHATVPMMALHTAAVARGLKGKFIVADMPFLSVRQGLGPAMRAVDALMKAGGHSLKIEGVWGHEKIIEHIVKSGVPVMGHLGLTPQSIHALGGFKVQGREEAIAQDLRRQAQVLEELGCFATVLECVPSALAKIITAEIKIPTIGIGAGVDVDGQVLVLHDLLGMNPKFKPKFLRTYMQGFEDLRGSLNRFSDDVTARSFPNESEGYQ